MNKPVYLCSLIIDLSKTAMYEFWYYVKLNMEKRKTLLFGNRLFYCLIKNRWNL